MLLLEFRAEDIGQPITARFEQQVGKYPDRLAVKTDNRHFTYHGLNQAANRIARFLVERSPENEEPIALLLEHDAPLIAAILGVLKAAKIYVPLDPSFPYARNHYILEDSHAGVVLTSNKYLSLAGSVANNQQQLINIDEISDQVSGENLSLPISPDALAYVLYTSGSTGQPKGVVQNHRNVLNDVRQYTNALHISAEDRMTLLYSCSVNGAVSGIFGALLNGAALYPLDIKAQGLNALVTLMIREEITFYHSVPTVFRHLAATLTGNERFPKLRVIRFGGERVLASDVELYKKHFPDNCLLYTGMGATETGHIREFFIDKQTGINGSVVPTGYAIDDKKVLLLDDAMNEVGVGKAGEIAVKSCYLSPGYWRKPELTRQAFLPDPSGGGERIYRTGDLGRLSADGCLEHLGRKDFQVKVRGYRIEVSEIEIALLALPLIKEAIVLSREDRRGDQSLVAYVVRSTDSFPGSPMLASRELRGLLKSKLPDYMLPSAYVFLEALPLTPNGKVDRTALPAPNSDRLVASEDFVAARTTVEHQLAEIWADVVQVERVGVHDNFFELGGHSLLATQVISRLRTALQVELPLLVLFENPTVAALASVIEQTSRENLSVRFAPILPVSREADLPISFSQERVWIIQQMDPTNHAYNNRATLRFRGPLDGAAFQRSTDEIVRRHEIFRTTFPTIDGQPVQRIERDYPRSLTMVDLGHLPESEREAEAQRFIKAELQIVFDIARLPLFRWTLLRLSAHDHIFIRFEHHFLNDGWSFSLFLTELLTLYKAFSLGQSSPLPPLPIQFADFVCWHRQWMQGPVAENQSAYWRKQLSGSAPLLELPTDRPRPKVQTYVGDELRQELPVTLCRALRSLSRRHGVTLFMTMFGAFATLLHRYSGQSDICIGSGVANRRWRETEMLMGMMLNTVAMRVDLSANRTFRDLLEQVRRVALEAYANQDLPFGKVVEALRPERSASYSPLYQVMFSFQDSVMPDMVLPDVKVELKEMINNGSAKFDLRILGFPRLEQRHDTGAGGGEGITLSWEYNTDLFDRDTIVHLTNHYQTLLQSVVADPDGRIAEMSLLSDAERHQVLIEWNRTAAGYPKELCIHHLFEAQVARAPDEIALACGGQRLRYAELNVRANRLAHYLRGLGVVADRPVGLCIERSVEMIVGLLAILKAGGAYLPLAPAYPKERLVSTLKDAGAAVLVTQQSLLSGFREAGIQVVCMDRDQKTLEGQSERNPVTEVMATNLAYVIYTSGSTGSPKGVMIEHRSVLNLAAGLQQAIHAGLGGHRLRASLNAPIVFDSSVKQLMLLLSGHSLYIVPEGIRTDGEALVAYLKQHRLNVLDCTPSQLRLLVEAGLLESDGYALDAVLVGGEPIDDALWQRLSEAPRTRFYNVYGPTECTVDATVCAVSGSMRPAIGRPIANTQVFLLDPNLNPVPIGVTGELHIGGAGLARGYLNRPQLTAEKFIPDLFNGEPGSRLYKTGDRARYRRDGKIEFLGRLDHQVKIRGFRIELGEIEAILLQHPKVREAVVIAREDTPGDKRLAAYIVPAAGSEPIAQELAKSETRNLPSDLRRLLKNQLPDYMLPSYFVMLDEIPLTPNGKIDCKALPLPGQARPEPEASFVAPRTACEQMLARIWCQVLQLDRICMRDNFFELGGHSLLATQVISRVNKTFRVNLPLRVLFEKPTVAALAEALIAHEAKPGQSEKIACILQKIEAMPAEELKLKLEGIRSEGRRA